MIQAESSVHILSLTYWFILYTTGIVIVFTAIQGKRGDRKRREVKRRKEERERSRIEKG